MNLSIVPGLVSVVDGEPADLRDTYLNGFADESDGTVEFGGSHFYRVGVFVVETTSDGFHATGQFDSDDSASSYLSAAVAYMEGGFDA